MKKLTGGLTALIVVLVVVVICVAWGAGGYNSMVSSRENVATQSANIDTQLQRRADLIPNLVNTVKGYAAHETEIITAVSDARTRLAGANTITEKASANDALSSALSRLLVVVESYPQLKADTQYTALMDELAGTENRIAVARKDYNEAAREYNGKIKSFPTAFLASVFGFHSVDYFEASAGAASAPTVDFSK